MRAIALIAVYNEERFIKNCLEHLIAQGLETILIDNQSTDNTQTIARQFLGHGLIEILTLQRNGFFSLESQLYMKQEIINNLQCDWVLHADADEIHFSRYGKTLKDEFWEAESRGYNAINFQEFTFLPTIEFPDHDHANYMETMLHYYAFRPWTPHLVRAYKKPSIKLNIASTGGHFPKDYPDFRLSPNTLGMRHYMCLSKAHLIRKYVVRGFDPKELAKGWMVDRSKITAKNMRFPSINQLKLMTDPINLEDSTFRKIHFLEELRIKDNQ